MSDGVVLDVAQLQALLSKTFNIGLDVGRGTEKVALVRLRLAKALLGAVETNAVAAESLAVEYGVPAEQLAEAEGLALHAAAFNGMPDPVFHLAARAMGIVTGVSHIEPDPRASEADVVLDAALAAATGLHQLLAFRRDVTTATTPAERAKATDGIVSARDQLTKAAEAVTGLLELAEMTARSGRTGAQDLN